MDTAVKDAMDKASIICLSKSLLLIGEKVSDDCQGTYKPSTILGWVGQFWRSGGYFNPDLRGLQESEFVMNEEGFNHVLLEWLKSQKRASVKKNIDEGGAVFKGRR